MDIERLVDDILDDEEEANFEDFEVEADYEDDDNRFAGLNSHGNDLFGRYGW